MTVLHIPARRTVRGATIALVLAGSLAACGGGGSSPASTTAAAGATSTPNPSRSGRFFNNPEFQKIRDCLTAAGIQLPTPSLRPSGSPPSPRPSGSGRGLGGNGMFSDPKVQAALKACGLTVPTGRPTRLPSGAPTGAANG